MIRRAPRLARSLAVGGAVVALATTLGGCVTLFPKETPAQLYRFGEHVQAPSGSGPSFAVRSAGIEFDQAAAGDAILTVTGNQVAYISGGRWATPAPEMFEAAVRRAFGEAGGQVHLIQPGQAGHPQYIMRLDVTRFEADYDHGAAAAPTVLVRVHATLTRMSDQALAGSQPIEVKVEATDNRVGAIADAFDQATSQALGQLVGWVDQVGSGSAGS